MGQTAEVRWPYAQDQGTARDEREDGSEYRRSRFERIRPRNQVGVDLDHPVTNSEPPRVNKHRGIALTPAQQKMVIDAATEPWCLRTFLEAVAALS